MTTRKWILHFLISFILILGVAWFIRTQYLSPDMKSPNGSEFAQSRLGPADIYPDPALTPGAINPDITHENISETICKTGWTESIRPDTRYTNRLKVEQISEYGYADSQMQDYEEDHFIPLELGGDPTDPKNLWPEPIEASVLHGGAHAKDGVENHLHAEVCSGSLTLEEAQHEIVEDWYRVYLSYAH